VQFKSPDLVDLVAQALADSGLPANRLELEITETVMLHDTETTLAMLHRLRALGIHIAMDDFGTGYSSLSYLRRFPFDRIKIDQSFVRELNTRDDCNAIVRAIASLGLAALFLAGCVRIGRLMPPMRRCPRRIASLHVTPSTP